MIRQSAFGGDARLLKGGLHCHTTRSDGDGTPEEVIRLHGREGFDFLALTDHNLYNYQNFAPDVDITIIPGMERDFDLPGGGVHMFHTVCIGPAAADGNGYAQDEKFQGRLPVADQAAFQPYLDDIHAHGNLTIYCHPQWSGTPAREFDQLRGCFAMELWNSGCAMEHAIDNDAAYWDELLMQGQRIWGVAVDDGHRMRHHGNGWVRVKADNDIGSILKGLAAGDFYASCGPEIYDFYIEDGEAVLKCSPCAYAGFRHGYMPTKLTFAQDGAPVAEARMKVPDYCTYLRGVVKDAQGRKAWTNPIFL